MRVIKRSTLLLFARDEPAAMGPVRNWLAVIRAARWRSFVDIRRVFTTADLVRTDNGNSVIVFDLGGNKYRFVVHASYHKQKIYVLRIMTHREYDQKKWKREL